VILSLDRLEISCFKSFGAPATFDLRVLEPGLHLLAGETGDAAMGSNGAGKSTVWDALCWCLYGITPRGLRGPQIRPWVGEGQTKVALTWRADNKTRTCTRTATPNSLRLDDVDAGQEDVTRAFGLSQPVLLHTLLFGQAQPLFLDLEPRRKMEILSEVLELERWDRRAQAASDKAKRWRLRTEQSNIEAASALEQEERLREMLARAKTDSADWEEVRRAKREKRAAMITELQQVLEVQGKRQADAELALDGAETERRACAREVDQMIDCIQGRRVEYNGIKVEREVADREVVRLRGNLKKMQAGRCPECGQNIAAGHRAKHEKALTAAKKNAQKLAGPLAECGEELVELEAKRTRAAQAASEFSRKADRARDDLDLIQREVATAQAQLNALEGEEVEENPHLARVADLRAAVRKIAAKCGEAGKQARKFEAAGERAESWVKGFREIRLYLLDDVLAELEIVTTGLLEGFGMPGWRVRHVVERETKSGSVRRGLTTMISVPGSPEEVQWENWSGGEAQRLRLIGSMALSHVLLDRAGLQIDTEIWDEPSQHLSEAGIVAMCDVLADRARDTKRRVIYCDHHVIDGARFESTIRVVKDANGSRIEGAAAARASLRQELTPQGDPARAPAMACRAEERQSLRRIRKK